MSLGEIDRLGLFLGFEGFSNDVLVQINSIILDFTAEQAFGNPNCGLIQREARLRLTELGRSFDDYLSRVEQENPTSEESNDKTEIGVGLYYYEMPTGSSDIKPT